MAGPSLVWAGVPRFLAPFRSYQSHHSPSTAVPASGALGVQPHSHVPVAEDPGAMGKDLSCWDPTSKSGTAETGARGPEDRLSQWPLRLGIQ